MSTLDAEKAAMPVPQPGIAPPRAYNGALSFEEVDAHDEAMTREAQYGKLGKAMSSIVTNLLMDDQMPLPDKAQKLVDIGTAALERIAQTPKTEPVAQAEGAKPKTVVAKGFWQRLGAVVAGRKDLDADSPFRVFKDVSGAMRFVAVHTNMYEDREKEILSLAAHKRFIAQADATREYPELWLWHTKGTRYGKVDHLDEQDGFVVASGTIDRGKEALAERIAAQGDAIGMSHGFTFEEKDLVDGVYSAYKTYEISTLPRERACNVITMFTATTKEAPMDPAKEEWLVKQLGAENVTSLKTLLSGAAKVAAEHKVNFKDVTDALAEDAVAPFAPAEPQGDLAKVLEAIGKMTTAVEQNTKDIAAMKAAPNPFAKAEGDPPNETPEEKAKRLAKKEFDDAVDAAVAKAIAAKGGFSASKDGDDASSTPEGLAAIAAAKEQLEGKVPAHMANHVAGFRGLTGIS